MEEMTTDIYHLSGKSASVRDEIFEYVADILNNKVSPQTAKEMRIELNRYHISRLGVSVTELKEMLNRLGCYKRTESERVSFNNDINSEFIEAMYKFQKEKNMLDADGIIGPKTFDLLLVDIQSHTKANTAAS